MQEVLDAMFERTVQSGDYVIRQGDDGDNFYVIDRHVILDGIEFLNASFVRQSVLTSASFCLRSR